MGKKQRNAKAERTEGASHGGELSRRDYEKELRRLQSEVCILQEWIRQSDLRVVVVFEGRDAAGKGGTIRALTERVSPRVFRVVALPAPSDREKSQLYIQRYLPHFPARGEVVIFDRSWYNRAGVERVLGFCAPAETRRFLELCPITERYFVSSGIHLVKYWLEVGNEEQKRRFQARIDDPLRQWKLSPTDLESRRLWYDYSLARDEMLKATDTDEAPWHLIRSDDKRRARLNCLTHFLSLFPYEPVPREKLEVPARSKKHAYDDAEPIRSRRWIPEKY